jgi:hypothetical protein
MFAKWTFEQAGKIASLEIKDTIIKFHIQNFAA